MLNPLNGYRGALAAQGKTPKNHMKEQRDLLRKKTEENQKRQQMSKLPPKEAFKLKQFSKVQSRVKQEIQHQNTQDELRPQTAQPTRNFLRAGSARGARPPTQ